MKNLNETEELFDSIFKEGLENGSAPVPPGVWEGVTSSIGSGSAIAGVAAKTAIWMKVAIAVVAVSAVSLVAYQLGKSEDAAPQTTDSVQLETPPTTETQIQTEQSLVANPATQETSPITNHSKNPNTPKTETNVIPEMEMPTEHSGPNPIYSIDANLINPELMPFVKEPAVNTDNKLLVEEAPIEEEQPKELNPTTEYTYVRDSSSIFIPTAVTPDGDGYNDTYLINLVGEESVEIIIYNINNEVLFRTKNKYQAWNCKLPNGQDAPEGSYLVKVIYQFKGKNKETTVRKLTVIK